MKGKPKKSVLILLAVIIFMSVGFIWWNNQWVMKVNGQKVSQAEYTFYKKNNPRLNKVGLQKKIVEEKVQLQQAEEHKIETISDYKSLQRELKKINQENEQKIKKKQVIHGLRKYDEATFYQYSLSITSSELQKIIAKGLTDELLYEYYQKHKAEFKEIDSKELSRVTGSSTTLKQLHTEAIAKEKLATRSDVTIEQISLNETTLRDWIKYRESELSAVNDLVTGKWSDLFGTTDKSWSYYCVSNQTGKIQSFDTVKERIALKLKKKRYQEHVKKWVKQAKVEVK